MPRANVSNLKSPGSNEGAAWKQQPLFILLITLSGLASLIYQVAWTRRLSLVLGVSTYAVATVLSAFLGGLALGAWMLGGTVDRSRRPLRVYATLEAGIGVFALLFPFLLDAVYRLYVAWGRGSDAPGWVHLLVRVGLSGALLLPPTFLMGGTLPAMCRVVVRENRSLGRDVARVYGYNTLGAALGALLAGFVLIAWLGLRGTVWFASSLNLAIAIVAAWLSRRESASLPDGSSIEPTAPMAGVSRGVFRIVLAASAVSGFAALGYEVLWTRGLMTVLHTGFTYSISIMLAAFLGGLVLGSFVFARFLAARRASLHTLSWVQIGIGVSALGSVWLLAQAPYLERTAVAMGLLAPTYTWFSWIGEVTVASGLVMLVPTTLMGIALPLSARLVVEDPRDVGSGIGTLYGVNTVGAILGALVAGFFLVPRIGTLNTLALLAAANLLLGGLLAWIASGPRWEAAVATLVTVGLAVASAVAVPRDYFRDALSRWKPGELLYFAEDAIGIVSIYREPAAAGDSYRRLYVNETSYASSATYARRYHKLLGHLPALLHPKPSRTLVIALGTGMTAGALARYGEVDQVDAVDISRAVLEGASYFGKENGNFLENPKARPRVEDGRHHLLLSMRPYDLITLEPPPPRFAGIASLYSRDFYELCRSRLGPGGVVAQWVPMHSHTEEEMRMLVRSFVEVFPYSTLWVPVRRDAILVGSVQPIHVDLALISQRMKEPAVALDLMDIDLGTPEALVATWFADGSALTRYVQGVTPITDDWPSIEFFAGRALVEDQVHLERLLPYRMNLATLLESLDGMYRGVPGELERQVRAMDHVYRGAVLDDRGDPAGRVREWRRALELVPESRFLLRLNGRLPDQS